MSRIALVDDDRNILTSVSMMLEAEGFEVETYYDGQLAWEAFTKDMPDIAVLEIKVPRLDGMDLLERVRKISTIPIIFLTSRKDEIDEQIMDLLLSFSDFAQFKEMMIFERAHFVATTPKPKSSKAAALGLHDGAADMTKNPP